MLCGAKVTEPEYFSGLKRHLRNSAVKVVVKKKPVDPTALVRHAARVREAGDYDEVWCVVDVDQYELEDAVNLARKVEVNLAISNPCFEYWLLLHFEDCMRPMSEYRQVERRLRRYVPHYDKAALVFADYAEGLQAAIDRAKTGCPTGEPPHRRCPSTSVWPLVEAML